MTGRRYHALYQQGVCRDGRSDTVQQLSAGRGRWWRSLDEGPTEPREPSRSSSLSHLTASPLGQWLVSMVLVVLLGALVAWNMPDSAIRDRVRPVVERLVNVTGLVQAWNVYAPDPARVTTEFTARIDYADGTSAQWQPPRGDPLFDQYRTYRWVPATIRLSYDTNQAFRRSFAEWLAQSQDHGERQPVRVELLRRWRELVPPGGGSTDGGWQQEVLFTLDLTEETPT